MRRFSVLADPAVLISRLLVSTSDPIMLALIDSIPAFAFPLFHLKSLPLHIRKNACCTFPRSCCLSFTHCTYNYASVVKMKRSKKFSRLCALLFDLAPFRTCCTPRYPNAFLFVIHVFDVQCIIPFPSTLI